MPVRVRTKLQEAQSRGIPFAVVSRGYHSRLEKTGALVSDGHDAAQVGDEARMLKRAFPDRDIFIGRDRHRSIREAIARNNRFVILDDGFQSTDIGKDLAVLLLNPDHPYYYLRNFPFLALRSDVILTLDAEAAKTDRKTEGGDRTRGSLRGAYGFHCTGFARPDGATVELAAGAPILGFSALGDNRRFLGDLSAFELVDFRGYPDHHPFSERDLEMLEDERQSRGADWLVCTEKDVVKLERLDLGGIPLIYMKNGIQFNIDLYALMLSDAEEKNII